MANSRHTWGEKVRFPPYKSEQECLKCDVVKVTRHEGFIHWVEFWKDGERIQGSKTPVCVGVKSGKTAGD